MFTLVNPVDEANRIMRTAREKGIILRLFGGIAFYLRTNSATSESLSRRYTDIDFVGHASQSRGIKELFRELGYLPRDRFNAVQGHRRLIFNDIERHRRVDIFLDIFEMCHKLDLKERMELDVETLTLADLLATKLQIIQTNEKDFMDILRLLVDHEVGEDNSPDIINGAYLAKLGSKNWSIYKTFTMNLEKLATWVEACTVGVEQKTLAISRIEMLKRMLEETPKTLKWKVRAKVGERIQWYELPEADKQIVDSRFIKEESAASET